MKILFICTGNICRSPAAEAVMRKMCADAGLDWKSDSAGIGGWHAGESPDPRARRAAEARGYGMSGIKARAVTADDYEEFDIICAMTEEHEAFLREHAPAGGRCAEIRMFRSSGDVPDPYFGGDDGFEAMMDILEEGCRALMESERQGGR